MTHRRKSLVLTAMALAGTLAGCVHAARRADGLFKEGDYARAAAAYEEALGLKGGRGKAEWLFNLGFARSIPGNAAFDAEKAMEAFGRLRRDFPGSSYARRAALPVALLTELGRLGRESDSLRRALEEEKLRGASARLSAEDLARCRKEGDRLRDRIAEQEAAVERLSRELQRLKEIDLGRGD